MITEIPSFPVLLIVMGAVVVDVVICDVVMTVDVVGEELGAVAQPSIKDAPPMKHTRRIAGRITFTSPPFFT